MEIYLIRHTRPAVPEGLCYGRRDVPLDEAELEARLPHIAAHLPRGMDFYSSPATRCARLAERLATATGGTLAALDARLHELDFGDWEGRIWSQLPRAETERWTGDIVNVAPPNGEALIDMWQRVVAAYEAILDAAHAGGVQHVGVVGHAGSLKVLLLRTLNLPPEQYALADIAQGRVTRIDVNRGAVGVRFERLMFLNR
jgi:alpha-ribazole phosphatase